LKCGWPRYTNRGAMGELCINSKTRLRTAKREESKKIHSFRPVPHVTISNRRVE